MVWTDKPPTAEGWYCYRQTPDVDPTLLHVFALHFKGSDDVYYVRVGENMSVRADSLPGSWLGPL